MCVYIYIYVYIYTHIYFLKSTNSKNKTYGILVKLLCSVCFSDFSNYNFLS